MRFWKFWFIGIGITVLTRILITYLVRNNKPIEERSRLLQMTLNILANICIILVGGILVGHCIGTLIVDINVGDLEVWEYIVIIVFIGLISRLVYILGHAILGLHHFTSKRSQKTFVMVFIVAMILWSIPIYSHMQYIKANTDIVADTAVEKQEERKLLYFCNVPVQDVSGKISGDWILGNGSVSGDISTLDELSYWYMNKNNEGFYDTAPAKYSHIVFIKEDETPYVEICSYYKFEKSINNIDQTEKIVEGTEKRWTEYTFYLPEKIMQYSLND